CKELLGVEASAYSLPPFDAAQAFSLYRDLFGSIEDLIKDKTLLVVPSGALTQLPLEVLVTSAPDTALPRFEAYPQALGLGQRQAITVLPSVASLKAVRNAKASEARDPFIGFGNPPLTGVGGDDRSAFERPTCHAVKAYQRLHAPQRGAAL